MKKLASAILFATVLLCSTTFNARANLVTNPGFETGTFSGWTLTDPSMLSNVGNDPAFAHSGTYHANLGTAQVPPGPFTTASLSQNIATTPGTLYNLSFWLANDVTLFGPPPGNVPQSTVTSFEVFWNGASIFSLNSPPAFPYTNFAFNNLAVTGPSTTLSFVYRHDNDFWRLDDVAVNVPDSMSTLWAAMPLFGLLGLMHFRARRTKAARV